MQGLGHVDCWFIKLAAGDHNVRLLYEQKNHQAAKCSRAENGSFLLFFAASPWRDNRPFKSWFTPRHHYQKGSGSVCEEMRKRNSEKVRQDK
jgi:hypothetical protein